LDINPEEVINSLSQQIGALTTENTMLKMALAKMQAEMGATPMPPEAEVVEVEEEKSTKKK